MISCLCLALAPFQIDVQRTPSPGAAPRALEFAAGTELRLHTAARLTGQEQLAAVLAELTREPSRFSPAQAAAELERLDARRTKVESISRGLLETVRDLVQPPLGPGQRIELMEGGRLALLGVPEQHAWLARFLEQAAAFDGLVDIGARIYEVEHGKLPESFEARSGKTLEREETLQFIQSLAKNGVEATTAPRVVVFPFFEGHLKVLDQFPYVKDFELKVLPQQGVEIADPVVDVAEDGVNLTLRGVPMAGERLAVYVRLDYARVAQPMRNLDLQLANGATVTVQRPEVTHVEVHGRFELAAEQSLLLLAPLDAADGRDVLVLLQARRVPAQKEAELEKR